MPEVASWAGVIVAALSLVVYVVTVSIGWWQREQDRRLSAQRASLRPELRKTNRDSYRLYLVNEGKAEARNVRVMLGGKPLSEHPAAVQGDDMPTRIGPNSEVSCLLAITLGCAPPFEIEVRWDDDSGADHTYRGTLTF